MRKRSTPTMNSGNVRTAIVRRGPNMSKKLPIRLQDLPKHLQKLQVAKSRQEVSKPPTPKKFPRPWPSPIYLGSTWPPRRPQDGFNSPHESPITTQEAHRRPPKIASMPTQDAFKTGRNRRRRLQDGPRRLQETQDRL